MRINPRIKKSWNDIVSYFSKNIPIWKASIKKNSKPFRDYVSIWWKKQWKKCVMYLQKKVLKKSHSGSTFIAYLPKVVLFIIIPSIVFAVRRTTSFDAPEISSIFGNEWFWIVVGVIVISIAIYLLVRFKVFKNFNLKSVFKNLKYIFGILAIALAIAWLSGIAYRFHCELFGMFASKQIDKHAAAATIAPQRLEYGDHLLKVGKPRIYYHSNVREFFYPAKNGEDARLRIRSTRDTTLYHDFIVVREQNDTILDRKCVTLFNNLDSGYGDYTVECLDHDVWITYSDKNLADSKKIVL